MSYYLDRIASDAERNFNDGLISYREYVEVMQDIERVDHDHA